MANPKFRIIFALLCRFKFINLMKMVLGSGQNLAMNPKIGKSNENFNVLVGFAI